MKSLLVYGFGYKVIFHECNVIVF